MKYLALIYTNEQTQSDHIDTPEKRAAYMAGFGRLDEFLGGRNLGGEALESVRSAVTVRVRGGAVITSDGPFAETQEQLGGFYLLECADIDEACALAGEIPTAKIGRIEVRPIKDWTKEA